MIATKTVECPGCDRNINAEIDVDIDVKTAAHELISNYKGKDVSAGDAKKLEDAIRKCLVDELGVSISKVE